MKTVVDNSNELIIKKSKFMTLIYSVSNKEQIDDYLNKIKVEYKDATHICYAYIFNNLEKYSDDNEPNGTAGMPILNVLKKEQLDNVLCVVVRYFGGIKLGAGGLVRAYTKACKDAIICKQLEKGFKIKITFDYNDINKIDYLIKNSNVINKEYNLKTSYILLISENEYNEVFNSLKKISNIEIMEQVLI